MKLTVRERLRWRLFRPHQRQHQSLRQIKFTTLSNRMLSVPPGSVLAAKRMDALNRAIDREVMRVYNTRLASFDTVDLRELPFQDRRS